MIAGLQKMTLLDFPGKVACTVFLQGCNYRCPFCHNSDLLPGKGEELMTEQELSAFLRKRRGLLDGVCISGGEPTLYPGLDQLLKAVKSLGFAVKLDTNGSRPQVVKALAAEGLIDYVAMDIKNSPAGYGPTVGLEHPQMEDIEESIRFLASGVVDHEFRTTVVKELHSEESIQDMGAWLVSLIPGDQAKKWFLQPFVDRDSVLFAGLNRPEDELMEKFVERLRPFAEVIAVRG